MFYLKSALSKRSTTEKVQMSRLLQIQRPKVRPPFITILSPAGMGKTTLGALFPKPVFMRTEDGMEAIPEDVRPDAFPVVSTYDNLMAQLDHLVANVKELGYRTLVVDSITPFDQMFVRHVLENDRNNPRTINQALGGYGAGMKAVASMHQEVRKKMGMLNARGMTIVLLAHSTVERIEPPDSEGYTKYSIRLAKE